MLNTRITRWLVRALLACSALISAGLATTAQASSHREAPFITELFKVDATDFFMFRSYESGRAAFVTIIADYIPFQDPNGGPNFYKFDSKALYEIHIDNNGDAKEDITFAFRFGETNKDTKIPVGGKQISIPLDYSNSVSSVNPPSLNVRETYSVQVVRGNRRSGTRADITNAANGSTTFDKPLDNVGMRTIVDYPGYANQHIYNISIPGCATQGRMFVGQRKEPFVINVGEIFDLINVPNAIFNGGPDNAKRNDLEQKNISTLALEVPIVCLTTGTDPVIGGWTTASVRQARLINPFTGSTTTPTKEGGAFAQVSRLANPLVNELFIGRKDKDRFNASMPQNDAQFLDYVTNPTLPALIEAFQSPAKAPTKFPRNDLVAAFLTGIPGLNKPVSGAPSEVMRLNTDIAPVPRGSQNRFGVIGNDNAGFPNGRRPGDDVVDIDLRVAMGRLCTLAAAQAAFGCSAADAPSANVNFTDGAFTSDARFDATFPYLTTPIPGSPQQP